MKCTVCGMELRQNAGFCDNCGAPADIGGAPMNSGGFDDGYDNGRDFDDGYAYDGHRYDERYGDRGPAYRGSGYDSRHGRDPQPRQNKQKKALLISVIALVLVVAILGGVIIYLFTRDNVSAAELQEAKDKYLPPAQAVSIDITLQDPSNDQITFKFDDRARVAFCTYKANGKQYDQSYSYDDAVRKLMIETKYRNHAIFSKEIDYGRIQQPGRFEIVEGYYVRLDQKSLGTEATESPASTAAATQAATAAPTAAPTEAPTEAPTKAPTEAPTEASGDYWDLYIGFLESADFDYDDGVLIRLNDDDIPELLLSYLPRGGQVKTFYICWIDSGKVRYEKIDAMGCSYQERTGNIRVSVGKIMYGWWNRYVFDGSSLSETQSGSYTVSNNERVYTVGDITVDEEEYNAAGGYDDTWTAYEDAYIDKSALPDHIRSFG